MGRTFLFGPGQDLALTIQSMAALYDSSGQRVEQLPPNVIPGDRVGEPSAGRGGAAGCAAAAGERREKIRGAFFAQPLLSAGDAAAFAVFGD